MYKTNAVVSAAPIAIMSPQPKIKQEEVETPIAVPEDTNQPVSFKTYPSRAAAQVEEQEAEIRNQNDDGDGIHPARQRMISVEGPLEEEPERVFRSASGANTLPLGQKLLVNYGAGAAKRQFVAPAPVAAENTQAARERSFQTVAPSFAVAARMHHQLRGGHMGNARLDPRRLKVIKNTQEARKFPPPAVLTHRHGYRVKQENQNRLFRAASEAPSSPDRASSLPYHPMMDDSSSSGTFSDIKAAAFERPESDQTSESEARIRDLEDENIHLRQTIFFKDRQIRQLKAERERLRLALGGADAGFQVGSKRSRYSEELGISAREV